jgi:hypothetical protein
VGVSVVALLWWWGVVFDLWIVVASILHARGLVLRAPFGGCGVLVLLCVFDVQFFSLFGLSVL